MKRVCGIGTLLVSGTCALPNIQVIRLMINYMYRMPRDHPYHISKSSEYYYYYLHQDCQAAVRTHFITNEAYTFCFMSSNLD